ncbi:hypothetical protein MTP99_007632 [Tenebrio molitor]|nr:hypothetical protein MTP99_007632 [Tenebrio molitor]
MEDQTKRTANFTVKEKMTLLSIIERYKPIIENKGTSCVINDKKNNAWKNIMQEFNAETEVTRTVKHLKLLYTNLKRKTRKDVAEKHKEQYIRAKLIDEEDRREINKTGGGNYNPQLDDAGAQILAIMEDQIDPLSNVFDDAADYFHDVPIDIPGCSVIQISPKPVSSPDPKYVPVTPVESNVQASEQDLIAWASTLTKKDVDALTAFMEQFLVTTPAGTLQLPEFSGLDHEDPQNFLELCEKGLATTNPALWRDKIATRLRGSAAEWWSHNAPFAPTYEDLKRAVVNKYGGPEIVIELHAQYYGTRQAVVVCKNHRNHATPLTWCHTCRSPVGQTRATISDHNTHQIQSQNEPKDQLIAKLQVELTLTKKMLPMI